MNNFNPPNPRDFPEREKEMFISDKTFELLCSLAKGNKLSIPECQHSYTIKNLKESIKQIYNLD